MLATAIHDGHLVRRELEARLALTADQRLREEDPFTEFLIRDFPNRIACHRSRFEIDLNRSRDEAVYLEPGQAWGLVVWNDPPPADMLSRSLRLHHRYYEELGALLQGLEEEHEKFVVLDVHSFNHRRDGPEAPPTDAEAMPDINIGTFSMDRRKWTHVVDPLIEHLGRRTFRGRRLDVRENVAFQGRGEQTRFVHTAFPETGCAIAFECKKIFMDEWTGRPDRDAIVELRATIRSTLPLLEAAIREGPA